MADGLKTRLEDDLGRFGLALTNLYITSITPPPEVQQAIDDKSRLGVFDDLNSLIKMKAAMALEKSSESQGEAGAGMGLMMPAMFMETLRETKSGTAQEPQTACPDCGGVISAQATFCNQCGERL